MSDLVLRMTDVYRVHGSGPTAVRALDGVSLSVQAGELVAVMGPSGSGKSTLPNLAGALDLPTAGVVEIDGQSTSPLRPADLAALRRRRVGVVFQDLNLIPSLTAAENIGLPLEPVSYTHLRAHETVLHLVCRLLLEKKKNKLRKATH